MSRRAMRDLGSRQYRARLNPLNRVIHNENIQENDIPDDVRPLSPIPPVEINDHINIEDGNNVREEDRPISPISPLMVENVAEMLLQNDHEIHGQYIFVGEILPDGNDELNLDNPDFVPEENNIFEALIQQDDDLSDEDLPNNRENQNYQDNLPLYVDAEITVRESMLSILALFIKHNVTAACIDDVISLIQMHCPSTGLIKNSLFKVQKYFNLDKIAHKKHFHCSSCGSILENENELCTICPQTIISHFIEMSVINQLQSMYERKEFFNSLQKKFERQVLHNVICDVYDGDLYKEWVNNTFLSNPNNISLSWYTDGVPVFKSSKISTWPIYLSINELPFEERKKRCNTLLLGLWYGPKKPNFNNFIYAFRPTFEKLAAGIKVNIPNGNEIIVRSVLLMGVCDLPAKSDCLNFSQFNAKYGCPVCFIRGEVIQISPRCYLQVYPYTNVFELRTSERCIELATNATPNNRQLGIKGHTAFSRLMPNFMKGMSIDRMHAVDSGVVKKLLILYFDKSHKNEAYSLYRHVDEIDRRLKLIKPPKFIHRMPRTVYDLIHWKASELKNFFFYYSLAIFDGIMNVQYFNHYLLLVMAMFILSSDKIAHAMLDVADDFLNRFVREFEILYHVRYCSINLHLLLHLPNCVKDQGPLWAHTCYEYENINGEILNLIHGTRYPTKTDIIRHL